MSSRALRDAVGQGPSSSLAEVFTSAVSRPMPELPADHLEGLICELGVPPNHAASVAMAWA
jgi:hypothetical protein